MKKEDELLEKVTFNERGLLPAVLQDCNTGEVLMVAYMNQEALEKTLATGRAHFWSRSRQQLWLKGETSGNFQNVEEMRLDCDGDTLLVQVQPEGPACHTGHNSCFYRKYEEGRLKEKTADRAAFEFLNILSQVIDERQQNPREGSYTSYLFAEGVDKIGKKVGEESAEVIIAAKNEDKEEIIYEAADLIYHLLVILRLNGISLEEVVKELSARHS